MANPGGRPNSGAGAMTDDPPLRAKIPFWHSLSARVLLLTIAFVMLAEVLIYVPSIANFRNGWLRDRLASAQTAALVLEAAPDEALPESLVDMLLKDVGAKSIALKIKGARRLLASEETAPPVEQQYDLRDAGAITSVMESFDTLLFGGSRLIGVTGAAPMGGDFVEIVLDESPLRAAMLRFSVNILLLSLIISAFTAGLVMLALNWLVLRPVTQLTSRIMDFAANPEDATRIIKPQGRSDEIGYAERELAVMQATLNQNLKQKQNLAALGLAVSKINHDLRNMLASAQLVSDRISALPEPAVQRFAPKLISTLGRAIAFCESTLAYGKAQEPPPAPKPLMVRELIDEVFDLFSTAEAVSMVNTCDAALVATVDHDYLFRILLNLCRNSAEALVQLGARGPARDKIEIAAKRVNGQLVLTVSDTGPGIPQALRARLFEAFHGSGRPGGTGLGLAIAADLARGHGGSIKLADSQGGAVFEVTIPDGLKRAA